MVGKFLFSRFRFRMLVLGEVEGAKICFSLMGWKGVVFFRGEFFDKWELGFGGLRMFFRVTVFFLNFLGIIISLLSVFFLNMVNLLFFVLFLGILVGVLLNVIFLDSF